MRERGRVRENYQQQQLALTDNNVMMLHNNNNNNCIRVWIGKNHNWVVLDQAYYTASERSSPDKNREEGRIRLCVWNWS